MSVYPDDGLEAETLIRKADTAMYVAKQTGSQSYQFYKPSLDAPAAELREPLPFHGSGQSRGWKMRKGADSSSAQVGIGVRCVRCDGKALGCLHHWEDALVTANNEFD